MAAHNDKWKELVYLSLGSNLGNEIKKLELARELIEKDIGKIKLASSIYKTEPWGQKNLKPFYNQVIGVASTLLAVEIFEKTQYIELQLGRQAKKSVEYENRLIDIDLLIIGSIIMRSNILILPHPRMHLRNFVLVPFTEIAPNLLHPELHRSIKDLNNYCSDDNKIKRIE
ncbi:MAG: 2-amino-4-hydroxy-6-hydroxymethyldihydropteridine diphosphokinase [Vicingaceae bacterium]